MVDFDVFGKKFALEIDRLQLIFQMHQTLQYKRQQTCSSKDIFQVNRVGVLISLLSWVDA